MVMDRQIGSGPRSRTCVSVWHIEGPARITLMQIQRRRRRQHEGGAFAPYRLRDVG